MTTSITEAVSAFQTVWAEDKADLSTVHFVNDKARLIERVAFISANGGNHFDHRWISFYMKEQA